jgi:AraC-like DNA-binding protein
VDVLADVMADVLAGTGTDGVVFARSEMTAPWGLDFAQSNASAGFHIVTRGTCWLRRPGLPSLQLVQGDVVLLAHGGGHGLADGPDTPMIPFAAVCEATDPAAPMRAGGGGAETHLVCGAYYFDVEGVHPILSLLPPVIHLAAGHGPLAAPVESIVRLLSAEYAQPGPGHSAIVSRLVDALFVYIVRAWLQGQPEGSGGWLGALRDPAIGKTLALIHGQPDRDWTLEALAEAVAMSRAMFARRFRELVGEPPATYLTRWRMDLASRLLRDTDTPLAEVARRAGYGSEYAFSKAFSRQKGMPPGRYRRAVAG